MADIKRQKGESFESFLRKFKRALKNSKKLEDSRAKLYFRDKQNKTKIKKQALVGLKLRKEKEYLRRIGKLPEDNRRN
jgi:ribosomal protein S21